MGSAVAARVLRPLVVITSVKTLRAKVGPVRAHEARNEQVFLAIRGSILKIRGGAGAGMFCAAEIMSLTNARTLVRPYKPLILDTLETI